MFVIDEDNGIAWYVNLVDVDTTTQHFRTPSGLEDIAHERNWSKADVTAIWNSFAGTAGFDDLKPQKLFKNRPYGLEQIWKAIQRLVPVPKDATSKPAALAKAIVEDMPKKKAKAKKASKAAVPEVEAKSGENIKELIRLMKRKNGVSIVEAMAKIGWSSRHTVRGRISILGSKGMAIESTKHETRGRVYRVA